MKTKVCNDLYCVNCIILIIASVLLSDAAASLIQDSDKLEQGDTKNINCDEEVPVTKPECPEAEIDMALLEPSGKQSEPTPISRKKIFCSCSDVVLNINFLF